MKYAAETTVSVERTRAEIETVVGRYGAIEFGSMMQIGRALICFSMKNRQIRFILPLPDKSAKEFTHKMDGRTKCYSPRSPADHQKAWEQACRQKWRALLLAIKAKLEAVESKISSFDSEFLSNIVQDNGMTIGESLLPQLDMIVSTSNAMQLLLPGPVQ